MKKLIPAVALVGALAALPVVETGCAEPLSQIIQDATTDFGQFVTYAQLFENFAKALWTSVQPLLGASQAAELTPKFTAGMAGIDHALVAGEDVLKAARAAGNAPPDMSAFIQEAADAVAQVEGVISAVQTIAGGTKAGAQLDDLAHVAGVIHGWRRAGHAR